jgi:hypothetical protein
VTEGAGLDGIAICPLLDKGYLITQKVPYQTQIGRHKTNRISKLIILLLQKKPRIFVTEVLLSSLLF